MEKKTINIVVFILIMFIFLIPVSYGFSFKDWFKPLATGTGFAVLSLSNADLSSTSPYFRGEQVWILTVKQGSLGQSAYLTINPEDIVRYTGKERPTTGSQLTLDYTKQSCEYPIQWDTSKPNVKSFDYKVWEVRFDDLFGCSEQKAIEHCRGGEVEWIGKVGFLTDILWFKCGAVCSYKETGAIGTIAGADVNTVLKTSIRNLKTGEVVTTTIDTKKTTHGPLGDKAYVTWVGNLASGKDCLARYPSYDKLAVYKGGKWRIVSKTNYDRYLNKIDALTGVGVAYNLEQLKEAVSLLNIYSNSATSEIEFGTIENPSSINAVVTQPLPDIYQYPVLTYYIRASWIGIYTPAPEPKIVDAYSRCFQSGDKNAEILVTVKNIGAELGNFEVYAECPVPFTPLRRIDISLDTQETKTVSIPFSGVSSKHIEGTCNVFIHGVGYTKFKPVTVCVDPHIICDANKKWCEGNKVMQCNIDGSIKSVLKDCIDERCIYRDGQPVCESEPVVYCENCFSWLYSKMKKGYCTSQPTQKAWFVPIPLTSQSTLCPISLVIFFSILAITGTIIYTQLKKKRRKKR